MSLYVHCDRCDDRQMVSVGIIAPKGWEALKREGSVKAELTVLCPSCTASFDAWLANDEVKFKPSTSIEDVFRRLNQQTATGKAYIPEGPSVD